MRGAKTQQRASQAAQKGCSTDRPCNCAELRTPLRGAEEEEEQDEDAQRLQEDIRRVREEVLAAEAATGAEPQPEPAGGECHGPMQLKSLNMASACMWEGRGETCMRAFTADEAEPMEEDLVSPAAALMPSPAAGWQAASPSTGPAAQEDAAANQPAQQQPDGAGTDDGSAATPTEPAKAADRAAAAERPKLPPPNLVTSWGPLAPARRILTGSAASMLQPAAPAAPALAFLSGAPMPCTQLCRWHTSCHAVLLISGVSSLEQERSLLLQAMEWRPARQHP